jgi:polar amino acid transport system substrate-binding protein
MLAQKNEIPILITLMIFLFAPMSKAQSIPMATGEWAPFTSENMKDYGEFTKNVTIVFKEMGVEPDYLFYPWRRCFDSVIKGRVWAAFPYSYTKKRAGKVWFTNKLSCSKTVFFYYFQGKSPKKYHYNSLEDLNSYRIGGVTGYFYEELFKDADLKVDYVNKEINAMEKLKIGRIDLMPVNELVGWNLIKTHFPHDAHNFKTLTKPLNIMPLHLIVSKDYPESRKLFDRFNQALQRCLEKGLIKIKKCE